MENEPLWPDDVRAAWSPPEHLDVSEWAGKHRVIVSKDAAEPGKWHNKRTPYLVEPMNAMGDDTHEEVVLVKAARVGGTEAVRNAQGYWLDQEPGPILWVYPSESAAREQVRKEIVPLIVENPRLSRYLTGKKRDITDETITLTTCNVYTGWAGSPQTLASRTIRRVVFDEVDKFPPFSGREADPVSLGKRRVTTFGARGKCVLVSTPTTSDGAIWTAWERCYDRRHYHIPCPACSMLFKPSWERVVWTGKSDEERRESARERLRAAEHVETTGEAWLECPACQARIDDRQRIVAVAAGEWVSEGFNPGERPRSKRVGYHIPAMLSSLGVTLPRLVGQFLRADDFGSRMEFWTQSLGLPYDGDSGVQSASFVARLAERDAVNRRGLVPQWARFITIGADTQKDGWYWVARAWGADERSRLVDYGFESSAEHLIELFDREWPIQGVNNGRLVAVVALVDAGGAVELDGTDDTTTDLVYRLADKHPRVVPAMGRDVVEPPFFRLKRDHMRKGARVRLLYHMPDTFKDILIRKILDESPASLWEITGDTKSDYLEHFENAKKVESKDGSYTWGRRYKNAPIDYMDAEELTLVGYRLIEAEGSIQRSRPATSDFVASGGYW